MTANIQKYLETAYNDETLAALIAHTEDGKLSFNSCCCFVGFPTADHSYRGEMAAETANAAHHLLVVHASWWNLPSPDYGNHPSYLAETEFRDLGENDWRRRERLLPILYAEQSRRAALWLTETRELVTA
ncbi:MAG TPA: hypothetical protein VGP89_18220 [Candidatus Angelobacter sp.]|jgi:hypothetical protein|nr:hypothetical protein [Candidatus Angelobacter sp.]